MRGRAASQRDTGWWASSRDTARVLVDGCACAVEYSMSLHLHSRLLASLPDAALACCIRGVRLVADWSGILTSVR